MPASIVAATATILAGIFDNAVIKLGHQADDAETFFRSDVTRKCRRENRGSRRKKRIASGLRRSLIFIKSRSTHARISARPPREPSEKRQNATRSMTA